MSKPIELRIDKNRNVIPQTVKIANKYENNYITLKFNIKDKKLESMLYKYLYCKISGEDKYFRIDDYFNVKINTEFTKNNEVIECVVLMSNVPVVNKNFTIDDSSTVFISNTFSLEVDDDFIPETIIPGTNLDIIPSTLSFDLSENEEKLLVVLNADSNLRITGDTDKLRVVNNNGYITVSRITNEVGTYSLVFQDADEVIIIPVDVTDNYKLTSITVHATSEEQHIAPTDSYGFDEVIVEAGSHAGNYQEKTVTPTKQTQEVTADSEYDALSKVTVNPYQANNQEKTVTSSKTAQEVTPDNEYDGLSRVTINPYVLNNQEKVVAASKQTQEVTPDGNHDGLSKVTVTPYTVNNQNKTATPSDAQQIIEPDAGYDGLGRVTVQPVTFNKQRKTTTSSKQLQVVEPDAGYDGLEQVIIDGYQVNNQNKRTSSSSQLQVIEPDANYDGLGQVIVEPCSLQEKRVTPATTPQEIAPDANYDGLSRVTVEAVDYKVVTFDSNGGSAVDYQYVKIGNKAIEPDAPVKTGYTFRAWQLNGVDFDFNTTISDNITLTADYDVVIFTVTYHGNGGTPKTVAEEVAYGENAHGTSEIKKNGYALEYWTTDEENLNRFDFDTPITADIDLYAKWYQPVYTITFTTDGVPAYIPSQDVAMGGKVKRPNVIPNKSGYWFADWFCNGEPYDFSAPVESDLEIYAHYIDINNANNAYVIIYDNGYDTSGNPMYEMVFQQGNVSDSSRMYITDYPCQSVDGNMWSSYMNTVNKITFKDYIFPQNTTNWFVGMSNLETIVDFRKLNTTKLSGYPPAFAHLFDGCNKLKSIDLNNFSLKGDYSPSNLSYMFQNCSSLTDLDLSTFRTDAITDFSRMFNGCFALKTINISGWNMSYSGVNLDYMFQNCQSLKTIYADDAFIPPVSSSSSNIYGEYSYQNPIQLTGGNGTAFGIIGYGYNTLWIDGKSDGVSARAGYLSYEGAEEVAQTIAVVYPKKVVVQSSDNEIEEGYEYILPLEKGYELQNLGYEILAARKNLVEIVEINTTINVGQPSSTANLFAELPKLKEVIGLHNIVATSLMMDNMFRNCTSLENIKLDIITSVTSMDNIFNGCSNLRTVDLSTLSLPTSGSYWFYGCKNLVTVYVPSGFVMSSGINLLGDSTIGYTYLLTGGNGYNVPANSGSTTPFDDYTYWRVDNITNDGFFTDKSALMKTEMILTDNGDGSYNAIIRDGEFSLPTMDYVVRLPMYKTNIPLADLYPEYVTKIKSITVDTTQTNPTVRTFYELFRGFSNLETITKFRLLRSTSEVSFVSTFKDCFKLRKANLSGVDMNSPSTNSFTRTFTNCKSLKEINLCGLANMASNTLVDMTFLGCNELETVYADNWILPSSGMSTFGVDKYDYTSKIVGGNGTTFDESNRDYMFARIDTPSNPGYFTQGVVEND